MMPKPKKATDKRCKSPKQHDAVAAALCAGESIESALLKGGYSPHVAKMGHRSLSKPIMSALMRKGYKFAEIGKQLNPQLVKDTISGRLYSNVITGDNKGNESAKLLGNMKDNALFTADDRVGVIVIQPPASLMPELLRRVNGELVDAVPVVELAESDN